MYFSHTIFYAPGSIPFFLESMEVTDFGRYKILISACIKKSQHLVHNHLLTLYHFKQNLESGSSRTHGLASVNYSPYFLFITNHLRYFANQHETYINLKRFLYCL